MLKRTILTKTTIYCILDIERPFYIQKRPVYCEQREPMLTTKKRLFIEAYKATKNASEACRRVGYSQKNASNQGSLLLKDPEISRQIKEWEQEELKRLVPDTKSEYAKQTFERAKSVPHAPTAAKYWEIGGKVQGFLGDENSKREPDTIINIIASDLKLQFPGQNINISLNTPNKDKNNVGKETEATDVHNEHIGNKELTDNTQPVTYLTHDRLSDITPPGIDEQVGMIPSTGHLEPITGSHEKDFGKGASGVGTAPEGGSFISVNPLPKSTPVLNSVTQKPVDNSWRMRNLQKAREANERKKAQKLLDAERQAS